MATEIGTRQTPKMALTKYTKLNSSEFKFNINHEAPDEDSSSFLGTVSLEEETAFGVESVNDIQDIGENQSSKLESVDDNQDVCRKNQSSKLESIDDNQDVCRKNQLSKLESLDDNQDVCWKNQSSKLESLDDNQDICWKNQSSKLESLDDNQDICWKNQSSKLESVDDNQDVCRKNQSSKLDSIDDNQDVCRKNQSSKLDSIDDNQDVCRKNQSSKLDSIDDNQDICWKNQSSKLESIDDNQDVCRKYQSSKLPKQIAPDGGFGWFVVLGCFIAHVVLGGLDRSEGLFFLLLTSKFGESAQLTSWPGAVVTTLQLVLGPIANILSDRYSTRVSVLFGAALMFIGITFNSLATNIYFYFISHSIIDGIGRGLTYVPGLIIVGMYFDKRAGLATGLATSGTGVGTFIIVPLSQYLADNYGFQGTFLILGSFACHMFIAGMLYRPISMHYRSRKGPDGSSTKRSVFSEDLIREDEIKSLNENVKDEEAVFDDESAARSFSNKNNVSPHLRNDNINFTNSEKCEDISRSPSCKVFVNIVSSPECEICENVAFSQRHEICEDFAYSQSHEIYEKTNSSKLGPHHRHTHFPDSELLQGKTHFPDSELLQGKTHFPDSESLQGKTNFPISDPHYSKPDRQRPRTYSCLSSSVKICCPIERNHKQARNLFRLDLMTKPPFLMYCLSIFTFTLAFRAAFTFLPALMESKGIPNWESSLALSSAGAVDTFGRIGAGLLLDLPKLRKFRLVIYNMVIFAVSLVAFLLPSLRSFTSFCVISCFYGLMTGAYISQKSVVLVDILESNDVPSSFGILMVFQGLGNLLGPPMFGALKDVFGEFEISFYLGGGLLILSGFIMALCNLLNILQKRKEYGNDVAHVGG